MILNEGKALKTGHWFSNELLINTDINYLSRAEYMNLSDRLAMEYNINDNETVDFIVSGMKLEFDSVMTVNLTTGIAVSLQGGYINNGSWGFVSNVGTPFTVIVPEMQSLAFETGGTYDRIDTVEIRPVETTYNTSSRTFKDPLTGTTSSSLVETKKAYGYEYAVRKGDDTVSGSTATVRTAGWIKLAEVYIAAGATVITQTDIKDVRDSNKWTTERNITQLSAPILKHEVINEKRPAIDNTIIPHFIGEEYTNLVTDPCDLTTVNWIEQNVTTELTDIEINGNMFTKLISTGTTGYVYQSLTIGTDGSYILNATVHKGSQDSVEFDVLDVTAGIKRILGILTFSTKTVTLTNGTILKGNFIDANTAEIIVSGDGFVSGNITWFRLFSGVSGLTTIGVYTYWAQPQITAGTTMFPFVDGTHEADVISVEQTMPDKFTFDMIIEPKFNYDIDRYLHFFEFTTVAGDLNNTLRLLYDKTSDKLTLSWRLNSTNSALMYSDAFDDGTSYTKLNQRLRIIGSLDLSSGGINDSRFIVIPLEAGELFEDSAWSISPYITTVTLANFCVGWSLTNLAYSNSNFEYLRLYNGLLVGDVASDQDAEELLQDMPMIFEAIPDSFIPREIEETTPVSSAIQQLANDFSSGVGIKDGMILPRHLEYSYTTTERDALINVRVGTMIFNTTQDRMNVRANNSGVPRWEYMDGTDATT